MQYTTIRPTYRYNQSSNVEMKQNLECRLKFTRRLTIHGSVCNLLKRCMLLLKRSWSHVIACENFTVSCFTSDKHIIFPCYLFSPLFHSLSLSLLIIDCSVL